MLRGKHGIEWAIAILLQFSTQNWPEAVGLWSCNHKAMRPKCLCCWHLCNLQIRMKLTDVWKSFEVTWPTNLMISLSWHPSRFNSSTSLFAFPFPSYGWRNAKNILCSIKSPFPILLYSAQYFRVVQTNGYRMYGLWCNRLYFTLTESEVDEILWKGIRILPESL